MNAIITHSTSTINTFSHCKEYASPEYPIDILFQDYLIITSLSNDLKIKNYRTFD